MEHNQTASDASKNPKTDPFIKHYCKCNCGQETKRAVNNSKRHKKGEYQDYLYQHHRIRHGCCRYNTDSPEYTSYQAAKRRCTYRHSKDWHLYGGAGIEFKYKDFGEFIEDVGLKPSPSHTIDRIDSTTNYGPGLCKWSTKTQNNRHRRGVLLNLEKAQAIRICVKLGFDKQEIAERFGIRQSTVWNVITNRSWRVDAE